MTHDEKKQLKAEEKEKKVKEFVTEMLELNEKGLSDAVMAVILVKKWGLFAQSNMSAIKAELKARGYPRKGEDVGGALPMQ